ncbi:hypothetical protein GLOIN_2v1667810 [Rhizophagus irregularis DAOM 181602=DAOM 197198]|uniref:Uncharacterized protein n=1 Tax=Rhizophagus irregularis (strain DAOM 181602 / DAOM 197198 / MUCL 43194) TaxID=747089 RepID=A0A2P4PIV8_RHIID|nr:hypothetical protein GLOIN_2v1667810 [Rhizophagus irregularis DAOM 181602=DAOM 197198]POG65322.1 hypothetical protein GLOIN_2v1667810 [Rhizophagus irregularis DAOM 181602=DAOM 197198]|eukprot:XP_025172188.1 hypothetical protein GLOIN_2v1667810 [Rhizophagus irregularis DAOM 181602=DAOM 197198]
MSDKTKESDKTKTPDKLDKLLAEVNNIFEVTISNANNNRVSSLTKAIRTCHLDRFQDIDLTILISRIEFLNYDRHLTNSALYRVASIADSIIINDLNISEFEIEGAIRMELQDTIFTHFPIQLQRIFGSEKKINVIVYPPAERMPEVLNKDN